MIVRHFVVNLRTRTITASADGRDAAVIAAQLARQEDVGPFGVFVGMDAVNAHMKSLLIMPIGVKLSGKH